MGSIKRSGCLNEKRVYIQLSGVIWKKVKELANGPTLFAADAKNARERWRLPTG